jgi:DNA-binding NtrC family response regulator
VNEVERNSLTTTMNVQQVRVLLVDDDSNVLASFKRMLRGRFSIDTAYGGESGLMKLAEDGPYAVVVADRHMPLMDGIEFLTRVKESAPTTVRIMLTGNADLQAAIRAINECNIFRLLIKPCEPEIFVQALEDAQAQHRLLTR